MKTILGLLALVAVGCGSVTGTAQRGMWVDDGESMDLALQACQTWAEVGVDSSPAASRESALVIIGDSHEAGCEPGGDGTTWGGNGWWTYDADRGAFIGHVAMHTACYAGDDAAFVGALAHEIGHALGCDHTKAPGSVMYPASNLLQLTDEDRAMYWSHVPTLAY